MCKAVSSTFILIVNILFIPISLILIIGGAIVQWHRKLIVDNLVSAIFDDQPDINQVATELFTSILDVFGNYGLVVFIFGLFLCILALCGMCGVCCRSKLLLGLYASLLLVIFLCLLIFTIVYGTRTSWFRTQVEKKLVVITEEKYIRSDDPEKSTGYTKLMDMIQYEDKCCGVIGYQDYAKNPTFKGSSFKVPQSCCKQSDSCMTNPTSENSYKDTSCFDVFWRHLDSVHKYILYALIGLILFTFLFAVLAIYLIVQFSRKSLQYEPAAQN